MNSPNDGNGKLALREQQVKQAEELLGTLPQQTGVAKGLFYGQFVADWVFPYPRLSETQRPLVEAAVKEVTQFCEEHLDPVRIDREADIPRDVIDGLGRLGVLGMTGPTELGGRGFSQMGYGKILEGGPETIRQTRQLLNQMFGGDGRLAKELLDELHLKARRGDEAREGLAAFSEKRVPSWSRERST